MKYIILFLFLNNFIPSLSFSQSNRLDINYLTEVSLIPSQNTIKKAYNYGFSESNFGLNIWLNFTDWNNDGLMDIIIPTGSKTEGVTSTSIVSVFIQKNEYEFSEDSNFTMITHAGLDNFTKSIGDINGDSLIDVYLAGYFGEGNIKPAPLFINNSDSLQEILLDHSNVIYNEEIKDDSIYLEKREGIFLDLDGDSILDFIIPHVPCSVYPSNHVLKKYSYNSDNKIDVSLLLEHPFNKNDNCQYWQLDAHHIKVYKDKVYLTFRLGIENTENEYDKLMVCNYDYPISTKITKNECIELKRNPNLQNHLSISSELAFYVHDLDSDGKVEFITEMWSPNKNTSLHIFNSTGDEITDVWFNGDDYIDKTGAAANGSFFVDINNDGLYDIVSQSGFIYENKKIIFINNGNKFVTYTINGYNKWSFTHLYDFNQDGFYELINIPILQGNDFTNIDDIYKIDIMDISYNTNLTSSINEQSYFDTKQQNKILSNYPNPFNPTTTIKFIIDNPTLVQLDVYNSIGQPVSNLVNEYKFNGEYSVNFDGSHLPTGIYFYTLKTNSFQSTKQMLLIK